MNKTNKKMKNDKCKQIKQKQMKQIYSMECKYKK